MLNAPGPTVAKQTPRFLVNIEYPHAMYAAACSWRVRIGRIVFDRSRARLAMFSPLPPNAVCTPRLSRPRTIAS